MVSARGWAAEGRVTLLLLAQGPPEGCSLLGMDSPDAVHIDAGATDHYRPVVGISVDGRAIVEDGPLLGGQLPLEEEVPPVDPGEFTGAEPVILFSCQRFSVVAPESGTGTEADNCEEGEHEGADGFHCVVQVGIYALTGRGLFISYYGICVKQQGHVNKKA